MTIQTMGAESNSSIINAAKQMTSIKRGHYASSRSMPLSASRTQSSEAKVQPQAPGRQDAYDGEVSAKTSARKRLRETRAGDDDYRNMLRQKHDQQNQILNDYMQRLDAIQSPAHSRIRGLDFDAGQDSEAAQEDRKLDHLVEAQAMQIDGLQKVQISLFRVAHHLTRTVGALQDQLSVMRAQARPHRQTHMPPDGPVADVKLGRA